MFDHSEAHLFKLFRSEVKAAPEGVTGAPDVAPDDQSSEGRAWLEQIFGLNRGYSNVTVTPDTAMRCAAAYGCIRVIADAVGQLPLVAYKRTANGGKDRATDHPLYALLHDQPNEWTSAFEFKARMQSAALRWDQGAFAYIGRVGGEIVELVQLDSAQVGVSKDPLTREPIYTVTDSRGRKRVYDRTEILHLRAPDDVAPLTAAREAIGLSIQLERHGSKLFSRGARPSGLLTLPKGLSADAMKRAAAAWNKAHGGDGGGGTAVLEEGTTWAQLQFNSVDSQFLELRQHQLVEICRPFRVPPPLVQDLGRATWANAEELGRQFLTLTLAPWLAAWEGALRRLLSADERADIVIEFMTDAIARADMAARMEAYAKAITNGILSPNEVRAAENRPPYAGGDEFRRPMNTEAPGVAA